MNSWKGWATLIGGSVVISLITTAIGLPWWIGFFTGIPLGLFISLRGW